MGLLRYIITKSVTTAAINSTIKAAGHAAATVIVASADKYEAKERVQDSKNVVRENVPHIKPTRSSSYYLDLDAMDVARELLGAGFECVTLKPVCKLKERSKQQYGKVESISINGNSNFSKMKKVPTSSYIIIEYLDFSPKVNPNVYNGINRIKSGDVHSPNEIAANPVASVPIANARNFCSFCGERVVDEKSRFCVKCGHLL